MKLANLFTTVTSSAIVFVALCGLAGNASALDVENNTDRRGNDYTVFNLPDANPSLCEQRCAAESRCVAYTYVKPGVQGSSARCWLKSAVSPATADSCCVSGTKLSKYMLDCEAAGVPLPPVWGDAKWQHKGDLTKDRSFDSTLPTIEVWTYVAGGAICYALPRKDSSGVIQLLGIICQAKQVKQQRSKACFWDNVDAASGKRIVGKDKDMAGMDPSKIGDGYTLNLVEGEQCTQCHRGDNVFTIYPGTVLDQGEITDVGHYSPIVQSGWALNSTRDYLLTVDYDPKTKGCVTCHSLPRLSKGYCGVLDGVLRTGIMPPKNPVTKPEEYWSAYGGDIMILRNECTEKYGRAFTFSKGDLVKLWGPQKP